MAALLISLGLLLAGTACGRDAQTLQAYTPGEGVNADAGNTADPNAVVHVRNLLVISKGEGQGVVSASLVTAGRDVLVGVTGTAIKGDGSDGAGLTVNLPGPVTVADSALVVLTANPGALITVRSPDLAPGRIATVSLQFQKAGELTLRVPVVDGNEPQYASIAPAPASTPSA